MTYKEFWRLHNDTHISGVSEARRLNLEQPEFNEKIAEFQSKMLEQLIIKAKDYYYRIGEPMMDDQVYDKAEEVLRAIKPDSEVFNMVGYKMESDS